MSVGDRGANLFPFCCRPVDTHRRMCWCERREHRETLARRGTAKVSARVLCAVGLRKQVDGFRYPARMGERLARHLVQLALGTLTVWAPRAREAALPSTLLL